MHSHRLRFGKRLVTLGTIVFPFRIWFEPCHMCLVVTRQLNHIRGSVRYARDFLKFFKWLRERDSHPRPLRYERSELLGCSTPRYKNGSRGGICTPRGQKAGGYEPPEILLLTPCMVPVKGIAPI